jgi:RNA polymerase sigma factor (sigma-70 family)
MAANQMSEVISHLRRTVLLRDGAGLTDGQLLEDYLSRRDEAALEALVRRHAPMVWAVCRRVLGNHHDAEDAFQATFLILVRKAASIAFPKLLANWLYGVAHQTALKARAIAAKRRARERQVTEMPEPVATEPDMWNDGQRLLDQELSRLPDKYRVALGLCDLEGKTRKEAARQLGVPEGTLAARVARARVMLAKRLARHGLAVSGGALAATLAQNAASAGVPTAVVSNAIKAASLFAAGQTAAAGLISAEAAALTEGVLQSMLLSKIKVATALVLVTVAVGVGGNQLFVSTRVAEGGDEPKAGQAKKPQPQTVRPHVQVKPRPDGEFFLPAMVVRDPSSGAVKILTRVDGIPVLKDHIEFHVKRLKKAEDEKSVREALQGLEESVQNMKDFLSCRRTEPFFRGVRTERKAEERKPGKEKPSPRLENGGDTWEMDARRLLAGCSPAASPEDASGTISLPATLIIDLARQYNERTDSGVQVRLHSTYPFRLRRGGDFKDLSGDTWEMEARRLLAHSHSPRCSPWGTGDTRGMNDFWHFSPWGKSDTWEWTTPRRMEKGGFWMFRRSI